jgi:hypothetical protein
MLRCRYPVRQCVAHPIYENFRVEAFRTMLQGLPTDTATLLNLGELMFQSHASYRWGFMCVLRHTVTGTCCSLQSTCTPVHTAQLWRPNLAAVLQPVWAGIQGH